MRFHCIMSRKIFCNSRTGKVGWKHCKKLNAFKSWHIKNDHTHDDDDDDEYDDAKHPSWWIKWDNPRHIQLFSVWPTDPALNAEKEFHRSLLPLTGIEQCFIRSDKWQLCDSNDNDNDNPMTIVCWPDSNILRPHGEPASLSNLPRGEKLKSSHRTPVDRCCVTVRWNSLKFTFKHSPPPNPLASCSKILRIDLPIWQFCTKTFIDK